MQCEGLSQECLSEVFHYSVICSEPHMQQKTLHIWSTIQVADMKQSTQQILSYFQWQI
jgi:hypothetical protein